MYILILHDTTGECTGLEIQDLFILSGTLRPQFLSPVKLREGQTGHCHGS